MRINLNNYEEWMIDYLDKNLDESSMKEVEAFLLKHPHIAEEFEGLENISISPKLSFLDDDFKSELKKQEIIATKAINEENYENYFIAFWEKDLEEKEISALNEFLSLNSFLKKEYEAFENLKLQSDETVIYENKDELKKKERKAIPIWLWSGAAAAVLLISFWFNGFEEDVRMDYYPQKMEPIVAHSITYKDAEVTLSKRETIISTRIYEEEQIQITKDEFVPTAIASLVINKIELPDLSWQNKMLLMQSYTFERQRLTTNMDWASMPSENNRNGIKLITSLLWKTTKSSVKSFGEEVFSDELQFLASENLETLTDGVISIKRPSTEAE